MFLDEIPHQYLRWQLLDTETPVNEGWLDIYDKFLHTPKGAETYFRSARLDGTHRMRLGVMKQALTKAGIEPLKRIEHGEAERYRAWLALSREQMWQQGTANESVSDDRVVELFITGDPMTCLVLALERIRKQDYPALEHDVTAHSGVLASYDFAARSLHGQSLAAAA